MALHLMKSHQPPALATDNAIIPAHVAIIMDGNGRWAKSRGLPRTAGHKKGADSLRNVLNACRDAGVKYLTIYAFSSENWKRPSDEVSDLMQLLRHYLERELQELHENEVCLRFIGDLSQLDPDIRKQVDNAVELTSRNKAFSLTVALSYGSRQEMVRAVRKLVASVASGKMKVEDINEASICQALDTAGLPEPDLLIRTGGEQRLSNFLLWQSAYTEFYFTDVLWPDFDKVHFGGALQEYAKRERRYGNTGE
jgi:undecaprenyl diphosphate synthase